MERWGTNTDKTNSTYITIDAHTKKNRNRGTAMERSAWKLPGRKGSFTSNVALLSEKYPRVSLFESKNPQIWNDKQVVVDDAFERMSGYEIFGIIDHDEFFIPGKNRTLKEMLVS